MSTLQQILDGRGDLKREWAVLESYVSGLEGGFDDEAAGGIAIGNPDAGINEEQPVAVVDEIAGDGRGVLPCDGVGLGGAGAKEDDTRGIVGPFGPEEIDPVDKSFHKWIELVKVRGNKEKIPFLKRAVDSGMHHWIHNYRKASPSMADGYDLAWKLCGHENLGLLLRRFGRGGQSIFQRINETAKMAEERRAGNDKEDLAVLRLKVQSMQARLDAAQDAFAGIASGVTGSPHYAAETWLKIYGNYMGRMHPIWGDDAYEGSDSIIMEMKSALENVGQYFDDVGFCECDGPCECVVGVVVAVLAKLNGRRESAASASPANGGETQSKEGVQP